QKPAVGKIVRGADRAFEDEAAHQIAVLALLDEIYRRWRAFLAPADVAQIKRLAEPACCLTDKDDGLTGLLEGQSRRLAEIGQHPDAADRGRRQDRLAGGRGVE